MRVHEFSLEERLRIQSEPLGAGFGQGTSQVELELGFEVDQVFLEGDVQVVGFARTVYPDLDRAVRLAQEREDEDEQAEGQKGDRGEGEATLRVSERSGLSPLQSAQLGRGSKSHGFRIAGSGSKGVFMDGRQVG